MSVYLDFTLFMYICVASLLQMFIDSVQPFCCILSAILSTIWIYCWIVAVFCWVNCSILRSRTWNKCLKKNILCSNGCKCIYKIYTSIVVVHLCLLLFVPCAERFKLMTQILIQGTTPPQPTSPLTCLAISTHTLPLVEFLAAPHALNTTYTSNKHIRGAGSGGDEEVGANFGHLC